MLPPCETMTSSVCESDTAFIGVKSNPTPAPVTVIGPPDTAFTLIEPFPEPL